MRNAYCSPMTQLPSANRDFHLESKDIPNFLTKAGANLPSSTRIEPSSSSAVGGVAVLISADRDPQSSWPSGSSRQGKFYGPSILSAPISTLSGLDKTSFGKGGLGLLKLRRQSPSSITHAAIRSNTSSLPEFQLKNLVHGLGKEAQEVIEQLWKVFDNHEGLWFSFILTPCSGNTIQITSPYLEFDDFAVRRQPLLKPYFESRPRNANTARAEDGGLFYVKLSDVDASMPRVNGGQGELPEGNVGCFGYGAGNAMATMDGLNVAGGRPANFLDGGGGANRVNAKLAIETLNRDPAVKAIFVNTFGGITRTDIVSQGIIDAVKDDKITKPIVVRMKGTGSDDAAKVLQASGLEFAFHDDFNAAAAHAVKAANQGHL
ncbi:related to succinyl-coa ligase [gdp-forming] beta-chain, mitochondrial precursor [Melanopsichium pennsylvanicum]|uniref:Related to succinyl-coa ligase [gdp-forming] beta-chain, mitochondrial n=2 Tax=Melanopsichium pennsylvanicum TaxID=63383 RepID=A0AAJ4XIU3_9BASI|nr:related to succinyl-coa ligase [gdp-forming] beta-chain, mitochondrial precursor [Melanopsichium pennsylvanicum 4]SNX82945.1 related to succinyl-coa ligase [gdp-forming] beta-chain, mitochondrial precursor [Melanopsichium pennsylvanicum]